MSYEFRFTGKAYYDGFQREIKPIPENGVYRIVGKGTRDNYHLLKPGEPMENRISIKLTQFKIIRKIKEEMKND